jgi:hypothetical protein
MAGSTEGAPESMWLNRRAGLLSLAAALSVVFAAAPVRADAIDDLLGSLEDPSDKVRITAAQGLGDLGPAAKYTLYLTPLGDTTKAATTDLITLVHNSIISALGSHSEVALAGGDKRVQPLLNHLKNDSSALVRQVCALALGEIEDPSAVAGLMAAQSDPDPDVKTEATNALAAFDEAFLVDGSITVLSATGGGSDGEVDCEVKMLVATVPGKSIKSWVTEDASIPDVPVNDASQVASAKHDCLDSLGDPIVSDLMQYVDTQ